MIYMRNVTKLVTMTFVKKDVVVLVIITSVENVTERIKVAFMINVDKLVILTSVKNIAELVKVILIKKNHDY